MGLVDLDSGRCWWGHGAPQVMELVEVGGSQQRPWSCRENSDMLWYGYSCPQVVNSMQTQEAAACLHWPRCLMQGHGSVTSCAGQ